MGALDSPAAFLVVALVVSALAGSTASIVGFGVGSLITPLLATRFPTDLAIAAVALPHLAASGLRGWRLRGWIDRSVLVRFGIPSAAGGLVGALVFAQLAPQLLGRVLGVLLILTATADLAGWSERWRPRGFLVWTLGAVSGFFGGIAGNQGGLRAAALSAFGMTPLGFVATSTIVGIAIDLVRTPIYMLRHGSALSGHWTLVAVCVTGALAGTLLGERLLLGLSPARFRTVVSVAVGILGVWFLWTSRGP